MTPQVAAGAGIGGLAVAGAGGSAIAYAAGAFDGNKSTNTDNTSVVSLTYKAQAEEELKNENKEYIGKNTDERIKKLLYDASKKDSNYLTSVQGAWENMNKQGGMSIEQPKKADIEGNNKQDDVVNYINKWCEAVSAQTLTTKPTNESDEGKKLKAFKEACFWTKAAQQ
ncbi:hypothetical protein [Candidatus Mycoplasma haematohominis]|uniref:Uncharacterized protein n=1 Tax=Candidatus Mycoplasma haematohominis TaxID=1494318 RepID=A0A478FP38_9MOLU|nr:hypothetical protein [Candidatus Mycoplasma haemohominis]GCE63051.1 hypothetical protein MHSWG343_00290 [Candidatus Mycoplasma haemohominis]